MGWDGQEPTTIATKGEAFLMNTLTIRMLSVFAALGIAIVVHATGPSNGGANLNQLLMVGSDFSGSIGNVPYETNNNGRIIGYDGAVACEIAHRLGFNGVSFVEVPFTSLLTTLLEPNSPIDIVISAMSIAPSATVDVPAGSVSFVKYSEDQLGVVFLSAETVLDNPNPATVLSQLDSISANVGVISGSHEKAVLAGFPNLDAGKFLETNLEDALIALIGHFDINALLVNSASASALQAGEPLAGVASTSGLVVVNNAVNTAGADPTLGLGIAIPSGSCQFYANIQQAINDMISDGTLLALQQKFKVPQGLTQVSGLTPSGCTSTPTINSNSISNYIFTKYCSCAPTVTPAK